jgi:hypothetical protein
VTINLLPALGKPKLAFRYTLLNAIVMPLSFAVGCSIRGIRGVAIAWLLVFPLLASRLIRTALGLTGVSLAAYSKNLQVPLCCTATIAGLMCPSLFIQGPGLARLITSGVLGTIGFCGWLWALFHSHRRAEAMPHASVNRLNGDVVFALPIGGTRNLRLRRLIGVVNPRCTTEQAGEAE